MEVLALKMKNNIKELRKARGLRQEDMAKLLGVSRQTIVAMENDKYDPTLELAIKTARLLEQPVEEIFNSPFITIHQGRYTHISQAAQTRG